MTINELQEEIIGDFECFDDWMDKYQYLIDLGKDLPIIADEYRTEQYLIKGCQSQVWLNAQLDGDRIIFTADSDALITKGIIGLLIKVLSGQKAADIKDADLYFIERIGLKENLSPTRSNGLLAMIKQMKLYAIGFDHKN